MTLNFYNLIYLMLISMGLGIALIKDGEPIVMNYSFVRTLIVSAIQLAILYNGGFFN